MQQAMQAQNMMWPPALATALTALINVPINLVLIRYAGFEGAAAAFSVSRVFMFLILACARSNPFGAGPQWDTSLLNARHPHGFCR